jgi:hypothetical protein
MFVRLNRHRPSARQAPLARLNGHPLFGMSRWGNVDRGASIEPRAAVLSSCLSRKRRDDACPIRGAIRNRRRRSCPTRENHAPNPSRTRRHGWGPGPQEALSSSEHTPPIYWKMTILSGSKKWHRGQATYGALTIERVGAVRKLADDGVDRASKRRCPGQFLASRHRGLALVLAPTSGCAGAGDFLCCVSFRRLHVLAHAPARQWATSCDRSPLRAHQKRSSFSE